MTLGVIEVSGDGNDGIGDRFPEVLLSVTLELAQNTSRNFLRGVYLVVNFLFPVSAHVALHRRDRPFHVGHGLTLGGFTNKYFAVFGVRDDRWGRTKTLGVSDYGGFSTFEYGHHRVGGS